MTKMKPRRKSTRQESSVISSDGPNWVLIGSIVGVAAIALIALAVIGSLNPTTAPEPTPILSETVTNANAYCESNPERCVITGNTDSEVTLIEVVDYGCPHCANFTATKAPTLHELYVDTNQIRWIVMPFALGDLTKPSAAAVMCANEQSSELGLEFHTRVFRLQGTNAVHTAGGFSDVSAGIEGLDSDALDACVDSGRYLEDVSFNQQAARELGVSSTPSFFLNGRLISGDQDIAVFTEGIEAALN